MKNKLFKNIAVIAVFVFLFSAATIAPTAVETTTAQEIGLNYAANTGLVNSAQSDPKQMAVNIVRYLMTFLGIIAVVIILLGGFKWMTAAGNEDKVAEAKKLIVAGIIGLIIILASFAIVKFVVSMTTNMIK